jgi:hypothetical protein
MTRKDTLIWHGYHDLRELPIKRGARVYIPKGTHITSSGPGELSTREAGRGYRVVVHHVLPGRTMTVGHVYVRDGEQDWSWAVREKDLYGAMTRLGLPHMYRRDIEAALEKIKELAMQNLHSPYSHRKMMDARIHTENPSVRWAGTGGYWQEADINDVEIAT